MISRKFHTFDVQLFHALFLCDGEEHQHWNNSYDKIHIYEFQAFHEPHLSASLTATDYEMFYHTNHIWIFFHFYGHYSYEH